MYHITVVRFSVQQFISHCGEIGRHEGLKIPFWRQSTGSTPVGGMMKAHNCTLVRVVVGFLFCNYMRTVLDGTKGIFHEKRRNLFL